jgi:hypothetical protein
MQYNKNKNTGTVSKLVIINNSVIGCIHLYNCIKHKSIKPINAEEAKIIIDETFIYQNTDIVGKCICKGCYDKFF